MSLISRLLQEERRQARAAEAAVLAAGTPRYEVEVKGLQVSLHAGYFCNVCAVSCSPSGAQQRDTGLDIELALISVGSMPQCLQPCEIKWHVNRCISDFCHMSSLTSTTPAKA